MVHYRLKIGERAGVWILVVALMISGGRYDCLWLLQPKGKDQRPWMIVFEV